MISLHEKPLVSVVLTTFNRPIFIKRAISNVFDQTWQNLELIVVDDCSPEEETSEIISAISDKRLQYIRREINGGVSAARNTGIVNAHGDYLAFYDDDDHWEPSKIEKQIEVFNKSEVPLGAVGCGRIDHYPGGEEIKLPKHRGNIFIDLLSRRASGYGGPIIMIPKFKTEQFPLFDESFPALEDLEFALRIADRFPMDFVPETLVHVDCDSARDHVWNSENVISGYKRLEQKYSKQLSASPDILAFYRYNTGKELFRLGRVVEARDDIMEGIRFNPGLVFMYFWYFFSFFGGFGFKVAQCLFSIPPPRSRS